MAGDALSPGTGGGWGGPRAARLAQAQPTAWLLGQEKGGSPPPPQTQRGSLQVGGPSREKQPPLLALRGREERGLQPPPVAPAQQKVPAWQCLMPGHLSQCLVLSAAPRGLLLPRREGQHLGGAQEGKDQRLPRASGPLSQLPLPHWEGSPPSFLALHPKQLDSTWAWLKGAAWWACWSGSP